MTTVDQLWTVPVGVDGKPNRFVLDSGAERTTLSEEAVRRLGLPSDPWVSSAIAGVGGVELRANATMRSFELGGIPLRRRSIAPALTFPVARMPFLAHFDAPVSGLLGADYLSPFDLAIDPADQTLELYSVSDCTAGGIPWKPGHVVIPATRPRPGVLLVPVEIDGVTLTAQLDTGASISVLSRRGLLRLGASATKSGETIRGLGRQELTVMSVHVGELRFGPIILHDTEIRAVSPVEGYAFDMLLGRDILKDARLWISYATNSVLVAHP